MNAKHTPTPWQIEFQKIVDCVPSAGYNFNKVIAHPGHRDEWDSNARFIVEAVNNYEKLKADNAALLEMLPEFKRCKRWIDGDGLCCACAERVVGRIEQAAKSNGGGREV